MVFGLFIFGFYYEFTFLIDCELFFVSYVYYKKTYTMLDINSLKKTLKRANRRLKVLNKVDNQIRLDVTNGSKPVWKSTGTYVRGSLVANSYEIHRALLLLWRSTNRNINQFDTCDDPFDFKCLM